MHSVANIGGLRTNQTVAIWGAGPVGLLCMAVAKALGASRIIAVDIVPSRLEFAKSYAATETFVPPAPQPNETKMEYSRRSAAAMRKELGIEERGTKSIDIVVEASGAEVSIQTAMYIVKTGGKYIQVFNGRCSPTCIWLKSFPGWNGKPRGSDPHYSSLDQGTGFQRFLPIFFGRLSLGDCISCTRQN